MSNAPFALLDQAELQQLALNASTSNDSASAIALLKEAVSRPDATAIAHYLLGAEYAQITMYERAIGEMEAAIALDPGLAMARLQLGMLLLGADKTQRATEILSPLNDLAENNFVRKFGAGLQHLGREDLSMASACLAEGIVLNQSNPALNNDMQNIIHQIESRQSAGRMPQRDAAPAAEEETRHVMLAAYTGLQH